LAPHISATALRGTAGFCIHTLWRFLYKFH
jgi:hypothetical protein